MKKILRITFMALVFQSFLGCAGVMLPSTNDPGTKLDMAIDLIDQKNRPIPAERMIREAIATYERNKDELELANAYRVYGIFYKSPAVTQWHKHYQQVGFPDSTVKFETRYQKALEYFGKARAILEARQEMDLMANIHLQTGLTYQLMGKVSEACAAFDSSLLAYKKMMGQDASAKVVLPKEYSSFQKGIADFKRSAGCNV